MKIELKRLHSPDIYDLDNYKPNDSRIFGFLLQMMIGIEGVEGEESFDVFVCSPAFIENELINTKWLFGRFYLFVNEYNFSSICNFINDYLSKLEVNSWEDFAEDMAKYAKWEFDGYSNNN